MWHVLTSHLLFNVLHIDSTLGKRGDFHQKVVYLQYNPKHVFLFTRFSTVLIKRDHKSEIGQSKIINSQRIKWKYFPRLSLLQWWKRGVFKKFVVTWDSRMTIWQPRYHACQHTYWEEKRTRLVWHISWYLNFLPENRKIDWFPARKYQETPGKNPLLLLAMAK